MKIVHFAAPLLGGYGETYVGVSLADQLAENGIDNTFVTTKAVESMFRDGKHAYHVLDAEPGAAVDTFVDRIMHEVQPDAIVLADYGNFCGHMLRLADK